METLLTLYLQNIYFSVFRPSPEVSEEVACATFCHTSIQELILLLSIWCLTIAVRDQIIKIQNELL